jgi:hypothetical protein
MQTLGGATNLKFATSSLLKLSADRQTLILIF